MLIKRTNLEDLTILRLLVDKLEEQFVESGIDFFNYDVSHEEIEFVNSDPEWGISKRPEWGISKRNEEDARHESRVGPVKRVTIKFHSKADFPDRYSFDERNILDDGNYIAATLNITWDYFTSCFSIRVGTVTYEKELNAQSILKGINRMDHHVANMTFDFKDKNRCEIKLIKIRLGKLYSKLVVDKKSKEERYFRKQLTDIALEAFPDLIDSLILGVASDEKGND